MADNQIDILIKYGLDAAKARDAVKEIEAVKSATTAAGKESVKTAGETVKATEEVVRSKKTWRDALKGVAFEYPVLGRAASLVMNPLTAAVAGITGAFALWRDKVNETTKAMGGLELPDFSTTQLERIREFAAVFGEFKQNAAGAATALTGLKGELNAVLQQIETSAKIQELLGTAQPGQKEFAKGLATAEMAARLRSEGEKMVADAGTPVSVEREKQIAKRYEDAAAKATAEMPETRQRIDQLVRYQGGEMGFWERLMFGHTFNQRYGGLYGSVEEALAMERSNLANQQGTVDLYGRFTAGSMARDDQRKMFSRGQEMITEAGQMDAAAHSLGIESLLGNLQSLTTQRGFTAESVSAAQQSGNMGDINRATVALNGIDQQIGLLVARIEELEASVTARISNSRRP